MGSIQISLPGTEEQLAALRSRTEPAVAPNVCDLRELLWSSIDNDTSRDLDQIEVAERIDGGIRVLVGIADVDGSVGIGSPLDQHAQSQTTTVYTAVRVFPMLPEETIDRSDVVERESGSSGDRD